MSETCSSADAQSVSDGTALVDNGWSSTRPSLTSRVLRRIVRLVLHAAGNPPIGVVLWNGEEISAAGVRPRASVRVRSPSTILRLLLNPNWNFAEAYCDGSLEVTGDLIELLTLLYQALHARSRPSLWQTLRTRLASAANSLRDAHRNAHVHYDLGNDFYRLWLDDQQLYTCAYFARPDMTLEEAQVAKMDHVCRKLQLRAGQTVVEAGSGWGALALHMARRYGVTVKAYNVSHEQVVAARRRAHAEGLQHRVEFIEDDWRTIAGRFDAFVSVGMLEHVGPRHYRPLGDVIDRCLQPHGRGLIHSIGRNSTYPLDPWIRRRIFPGAHVPTLAEMKPIFEPHRFSILDVENLRLHYSTTLRRWLERYEQSADKIERMFGTRFVRMWRLYLAGSVATFDTGWLQLFQIVFARPDNNEIAPTRDHLYASAPAASGSRSSSEVRHGCL